MQPNAPKPEAKKTDVRRDNERAELYRLRDAAWESQKSSGKTGTCEFLKLLLDLHREIVVLDKLEAGDRGVAASGTNYDNLKRIDELLAEVRAVKAGNEHLAEQVHAMQGKPPEMKGRK